MTRTLTFAALAAVLAAPAAHAQVTPPAARPTAPQPAPGAPAPRPAAPGTFAPGINPGARGAAGKAPVSDALFAAAAASGGMAEVALAQMGERKATDPELKKFSQQMVQEHSMMNRELMTLASQRRMPLPQTLDACAQFCSQSLAGLSGEEFDKCYAKAQLVAHLNAVATFTAESERGQDPAVKALAAKALPHIKEHLKMIHPIAMRYMKDQDSDASSEKNEKHERGDSDAAEKKDK